MNSSPSSSSPISVCLAICVRGVWTNTCPTVTAPLGSDDGGRLVLSVEESTRASLLCAQQRDFWRWWLLPCSRCGARMLHTRKQRLHEMHVKAINVISPILQISEAPVGGSVWSGCKDAKGGSGGISVTCDTFVWEISANQTSSWGLRVCVFIRLHSGLMGAASASITCNHGLRWRGGGWFCVHSAWPALNSFWPAAPSTPQHCSLENSGQSFTLIRSTQISASVSLFQLLELIGRRVLCPLPCFCVSSAFHSFCYTGFYNGSKKKKKNTWRHHRLEQAQTAVHKDDLRRHKKGPN